MYSIQSHSSLTVSDLTFDVFGVLNHTDIEWEVSEIDMNFTISGISGAFENLTDNFFNDLLNLSGPEILELGWPILKPTVEEAVSGVCITKFTSFDRHFLISLNFQAVATFLNDFTIQELMGFLFGAGMDWSDVDDQTTTVRPSSALPLI